MKKISLILTIIIIICTSIWGIFNHYKGIEEDKELLKIYFFNVGNADATLITNNGEAMLIDGGNKADSDLLIRYMRNRGIAELKYVIATHDDRDHIGGLGKIIDVMKVETVYMPNTNKNTSEVNELVTAIHNKNKEIQVPEMDTTYYLGKSTWQVKWVGDATEDKVDSNQSSIVIELEHGSKKYLFMGDYEPIKENNPQYKKIHWNPVNILKVAHHGSDKNLIEGFFELVKPDYAIISAGENRSWNFPSEKTVEALQAVQKEPPIEILVTRYEQQTIIVISDGNNIRIEKDATIVDGN